MTELRNNKTGPIEPPFQGRVLWFTPAILSGVFLLILGGLLHQVHRQSFNLKKEELKESLQLTFSSIKLSLSSDLEFLNLLSDSFSRGVLNQQTFKKQTFGFVTNHPELLKVFYADSVFRMQWVSPYENNKSIVGLMLSLPEPLRVSGLASKSGKPSYSRPFRSNSGERVFEVYVPIFREEKFLGLFGAVYSLKKLLKHVVPETIRNDYQVSIVNPQGIVITRLSNGPNVDPDLTSSSPFEPSCSRSTIQLSRYADSFWNWWSWGLALVAIGLASGMVWTMMLLRKNVDAHSRYEKELVERQNHSKKLVAELSQSNEELEQFAYVASHDLQEPLHKIRAFSELLMKSHSNDLNPTGLDYLERMHGASIRMQEMIENLLVLSRITTQAEPFKKVYLNQAMDDVLSDLELLIQKYEAVVYVDDLPSIHADPTQINQLFSNLVKNALKYHRDGVKPEIKVYWEPNAKEDAALKAADRFCRIYVSDNGIGFEEEYVERIFQPFEQLHPRRKHGGLGIGLAICRKIVRRHGGSIDAYSTLGKGSTFFIHLPYRPTLE